VTVTLARVYHYDTITGTTIAPTLNSASTPSGLNVTVFDSKGFSGILGAGLYGCRQLFPSAIDFTGYPFVYFKGFTTSFAFPSSRVTSYLTGGISVLFEDGSGNYSGYRIYGAGITDYDAGDGTSYFTSFTSSAVFILDRTATPAISSGTLDWSDIVAYETHADANSTTGNLGFNHFAGYGPAVCTGTGNVLSDFSTAYALNNFGGDGTGSDVMFLKQINRFSGSTQTQFSLMIGFDVGDGSTTTTLVDSGVYIAFLNPQTDQSASVLTTGYLLNAPEIRYITVKAAATLTLDDGSIASSSLWGIKNEGTLNLTDFALIRASELDFTGASTISGGFADDCRDVKVDGTSDITNFTIKNASLSTDDGLVITSAAGDYSGLTVNFDNNLGKDITLGAGGAGIYDLTGITVSTGYTLKIHNNSSNAITVQIPNVSYTTSGVGTVTVEVPAITYTLALPNITNGSKFQIYNVTTDTELTIGTASGGISEVYTEGVDYTAGDTGRYRIAYASGLTAKKEVSGTFTFPAATSANSIPVTQVDQEVYALYGKDGSAITGISWDSVGVQFDFNDADDSLDGGDIGAWYYYFITTDVGIDEVFGSFDWSQVNRLRNIASVTPITFDNVAVNPLQINNAWIDRDDNASIIASSSNSIQINPPAVFVAGGSQIADDILARNHEGGRDGGRTVSQCLMPNRNRVVVDDVAGTITYYKGDDVTVEWVSNVGLGDRAAINSVDPQ